MANDLAKEVEHSQVQVILFYFAVAYFEVVEERNQHRVEGLAVVKEQMVGVCIDK